MSKVYSALYIKNFGNLNNLEVVYNYILIMQGKKYVPTQNFVITPIFSKEVCHTSRQITICLILIILWKIKIDYFTSNNS